MTSPSTAPSSQGAPAVEIERISRCFGEVAALNDVTLRVAEGAVISLIGPSGSGKSTLLRCINNLQSVDSGSIRVFGDLVGVVSSGRGSKPMTDGQAARQRAEIGMVFQNFNLFGHMSALENIMSGLVQVRRLSRPDAKERAQDLLRRVGLESKGSSYPLHLSGGQQQRVAIARALAMSPRIMLFDEPTSALDPETITEVLDVIRALADGGMTLLIATHEMGFARQVSHQVVFMDQGKIIEQGEPDKLFLAPESVRCRDFLGKILHAGRGIADVATEDGATGGGLA